MINKKNILILLISILTSIQVILYFNNNQKTNLRFFIWNLQEIKMGKLISISFVSGLILTTLLNKTSTNKLKENYVKNQNTDRNEEYFEKFKNEANDISDVDMPPQRDIRDSQPTISVNYRVIKNNEDNFPKNYDDDLKNNQSYEDDWSKRDKDW